MKFRVFAALAAVSLVAAPIAPLAAKPTGGEIELHIEASASVPPDMAQVPIVLIGKGKTDAEAQADLDRQDKELRTGLAGIGIDSSKIVATDLAEAAALNSVDVYGPECLAASEAAVEAAPAPKAKRKAAAPPPVVVTPQLPAQCQDPPTNFAGRMLTVQLEDLGKFEQLQALTPSQRGYPVYGMGKTTFAHRDPVAAQQQARKDAIAQAQSDAESYAAALGMKVVRIVRISNARPHISMHDIMSFFLTIDRKGRNDAVPDPDWLAGTITENVSIDFVLAPK